jgi:hypothetical protein
LALFLYYTHSGRINDGNVNFASFVALLPLRDAIRVLILSQDAQGASLPSAFLAKGWLGLGDVVSAIRFGFLKFPRARRPDF